jgi:hypothetical protein
MFDSFKKIIARLATANSYITGIWGIDKWLVYFGALQPEAVAARVAIATSLAAISVVPIEIQSRSMERFMGVEDNVNVCSMCDRCSCLCKSLPPKILSGVLRTAFSSASLSMVLYGWLKVPGTASIISILGSTYLVTQILNAHFGNSSSDAEKITIYEETRFQRFKRYALMTLAAPGGIMSAGMALLGWVAITYIIQDCSRSRDTCTLNPHIDHHKSDVMKIDLLWLITFMLPMVRQGFMYVRLASDTLVYREPFDPEDATRMQRILQAIDNYLLIPASALVVGGGASAGLLALTYLILHETFGVEFLPSAITSAVLTTLLSVVPGTGAKWRYFGYDAPILPEMSDRWLKVINAEPEVTEESPLLDSRQSGVWGYVGAFWKRVTSCGSRSPDYSLDFLDEEDSKLLTR